ncbi:hypothetical protein TKK_0005481 [Trichogramma kaykai]
MPYVGSRVPERSRVVLSHKSPSTVSDPTAWITLLESQNPAYMPEIEITLNDSTHQRRYTDRREHYLYSQICIIADCSPLDHRYSLAGKTALMLV